MTPGHVEGTGPFFAELGELLDALEAAELRRRITGYARELDRAERQRLLAALSAPVEDAGGVVWDPDAEAAAASDDIANDPLMRDIEGFRERVEAREYMDGWGWDPDIRDERAWGDESWALEMDGLFARAEAAFLAGNRHLAAEAYEALFTILLLDMDEPLLPAPGSSAELLDTDLHRARACCYRAIYEATPEEDRPGRLVGAMRQLHWFGDGPVGLGDVADADADPLPGFAAFLPAWVKLLEEATRDSSVSEYGGWAGAARWLLRDATYVMGGVDGLADLARGTGRRHPEAFHDWIDRLLDEDRGEEALAAAEAGMDAVVDPGGRAALADGAADLARWLGSGTRELRARQVAWRAGPTGQRLRTLVRAEDEHGGGHAPALERELDALRAGEPDVPERAEDEPALPGALLAALELLTGRFDEAIAGFRRAPALGWSGADHPGYVVFPFLAGAGADVLHGDGSGAVPAGSVLDGFLEGMDGALDRSGWSWPTSEWWPRVPGTEDDDPPAMRALLSRALERHPPDAEARSAFLEEADAAARERVEAIVSNKHRKAYRRAAEVAAAVAEGWILAGDPDRARGLLVDSRRTFSRYYAFTGELDSVVKGSPLLRDYEPRRA